MTDIPLARFLHEASLSGGVDFHLHSYFSDGAQSPAQLVRQVSTNKLKAFALTDHDSMAGIPGVRDEMDRLSSPGLPRFVPGVECSAQFQGREVHVLGYFTEDNPADLQAYLQELAWEREDRNRRMLARLNQLGYAIQAADLADEADASSIKGRVHMALWLVREGGFATILDAFHQLLAEGKPAYIPRQRRSVEEVAEVFKRSGGLAVLAHPQLYGWCDDPDEGKVLSELQVHFEALRGKGIEGIECFHGQSSSRQSQLMFKVAAGLDLICTAGSDSHGRDDQHAEMYHGESRPFS
ncbi:MAG: PHP domain-containing protein [Clostridiaceae bacterium]|jgi:predicted metal-dependent phosphoesterase TrpH|nr:PHP domain-containing protein [Clostridiaceae bacterium]